VEKAKKVKYSIRGELEITSIINMYFDEQHLNVELLGRGFAWLDTGTHESLLEAGQFVQTIEKRQGYKIACLEEIAFNNGWISKEAILLIAGKLNKIEYGQYLSSIVKEQ
jgi:glucose-1-phosphate thymidylyltransferase